jgi:hypothetical protein
MICRLLFHDGHLLQVNQPAHLADDEWRRRIETIITKPLFAGGPDHLPPLIEWEGAP